MLSRKVSHWSTLVVLLFTSCTCTRIQLYESKTLGSPLIRASRQTDRILFSAGSDVILYVNGLEKIRYTPSDGIAYIGLSLFNGDVVGLKVSNKNGPVGIAAEIAFHDQRFVTGRDQWLAIAISDSSNEWLKPTYSSSFICHWKSPEVLERNFHSHKCSQPSAAKSVWARDAASNDNIFLRYRIGGENCASTSQIYFAADNRATLFINGNQIQLSTNWWEYEYLQAQLNYGDVVALRVEDDGVWFGAVLAINLGSLGHWLVTGKGEWRATKAFEISGDENAWTTQGYSACEWPAPVLRNPGEYIRGKAEDFPYSSTGAEYVWASNAGVHDKIFLRTVIGGGC